MGLYSEYLDKSFGWPALVKERKKQLSQISKLRGGRAILTFACAMTKRAPIGIDYDDRVPILDQITNLKGDKIDVILETPGGYAEIVEDIVRQIRIFRPELIISSDPYRRYFWHRDHRIVGQVVLDAVFPFARDLWSFPDLIEEGLKPHKVSDVWLWAPEECDINHRSDITDTFDLKVKALKCHESQIKDSIIPELEKWLCTRAKDIAEGEDFKLAEAFHRVDIWW